MGKKEKLIQRLCSKPKDFQWSELRSLLISLGYREIQGKGSRVRFVKDAPDKPVIGLHVPHPDKTLKMYVIRYVMDLLRQTGEV